MHHLCAVLNYILQQTGSNYSDVISGRFLVPVIPYHRVKLGDPRINISPEIQLKPSDAAFSTVFKRNV